MMARKVRIKVVYHNFFHNILCCNICYMVLQVTYHSLYGQKAQCQFVSQSGEPLVLKHSQSHLETWPVIFFCGLDVLTDIYCVGWMHWLLFNVWAGCMDWYLLCGLDAWTVIYCVGWMHGLYFYYVGWMHGLLFFMWAGCMDWYLLFGLDAWTVIYCVGWMHGLLFIVWAGFMDCYF